MSAERARRPFVDRPVGEPDAADSAARHAAQVFGLEPPTLIRRGMNALYRSGEAVLRVGAPTAPATAGLALVRQLHDAGVPVLLPLREDAVVVGAMSITLWPFVASTGAPVDWRTVGAAVRRVHALSPHHLPAEYPVPHPTCFPWWQFDRVLEAAGDDVDEPARLGLQRAIERHRGWEDRSLGDEVICHGDVHPGNVIMSANGPLLIDWDLMCWAPPGWDHAMLLTLAERWGGDGAAYDAFTDGYGRSFAADSTALSCADLRNVAATLMRVKAAQTNPAAAEEADRRLRYWRNDPDAPVWQAQ